jgi:hypothetical protein
LKKTCDENAYNEECSLINFPMVSGTLGIFPNDKIYIFLMQFFTAVQFMSFRAYHKKLSTLTSPLINSFLLIVGLTTCISGPILALFDKYHHGNDPPTEHE